MEHKNWELIAYKLWVALQKVEEAGDIASMSSKHYRDLVTKAEKSRYLLLDQDTVDSLHRKYRNK